MLFLIYLLFSALLWAQNGEGALVGQLADSTGAPVPHVRLVLRNAVNGTGLTLITSDDGSFDAPSLAAGPYEIIVISPAFGLQHANVKIVEDETARVRITPGIVTRFAAAASGLPADGRTDLDAIRETASLTGASLALHSFGMRAQSNSFVLDGLDVSNPWTREPLVLPPPESIEIATVLDGYVPAYFGHLAGAAVVARTPSGSNAFHGGAFENVRNSALDARNFFDATKPSSRWNRFGGTLGGPIEKDKWFVFGALELLRSQSGRTVMSTVPTDAQRAGNFASVPIYDPLTITPTGFNVFARQPFAGEIPAARIPLGVQELLALYPRPNLAGGANNFRYASSAADNSAFGNLRTDKTFAERHALFVRLNYQGNRNQSPSAFPTSSGSDPFQDASDTTTNTNSWAGAVSLTSTLRPALTNQLRVGYTGANENARANNSGPTIHITGFTSLGAAGAAPFHIRTSNFEVNDAVSLTTTHHAWQFGFQALQRSANGNASDVSPRGSYIFTPDYTSYPGSASMTGDAFASFLLGFPSEVQRDVQFTDYTLRAWEWSGFVQDQFRYKRLTVEAGLRYSLLPPASDANGRLVNFNFSKATPALGQPVAREAFCITRTRLRRASAWRGESRTMATRCCAAVSARTSTQEPI